MTFKLPETVKVGYRTLKVEELPYSDTPSEYGWYRPFLGKIEVLVENQAKPEIVNTLIHEILHAIWDLGALKDPSDEEAAISIMANGLVALMQDEPKLLRRCIAAVQS